MLAQIKFRNDSLVQNTFLHREVDYSRHLLYPRMMKDCRPQERF